jgi:7-cyano-7-deazaguanine synthase in queuosine biosynthesis
MNAHAPVRLLRVVEEAVCTGDHVAILGRDIRTSPEKIAQYLVTQHEPIYEDLATLVESMAYWDRRIVRRRSLGWAREMPIQVPLFEHSQFLRTPAVEALAEAARFLTGDRWSFEFLPRKGPAPGRQSTLPLPRDKIKHVVPFSDGLDSFAQVQLSISEHGRDAVMPVRSGLGPDRIFPDLVPLRVPRKFSGARMREVSYRTRPLVFYTLAAIAAAITDAVAVVIGENGQGAIGPACVPFADEWPFRSAHPAFVERWGKFLECVLERSVRFEQPQLWKTKGEVLSNLLDNGLIVGWEQTNSCATRHKDRYGRRGCGICGGCLLHTVSAHAAGLTSHSGANVFSVSSFEDIGCDRDGTERRMTAGERAVAVGSIIAMMEFARLANSPEGELAANREALLIDPGNRKEVRLNLLRLLHRHRTEWEGFMSSLPDRSWVREIVGCL